MSLTLTEIFSGDSTGFRNINRGVSYILAENFSAIIALELITIEIHATSLHSYVHLWKDRRVWIALDDFPSLRKTQYSHSKFLELWIFCFHMKRLELPRFVTLQRSFKRYEIMIFEIRGEKCCFCTLDNKKIRFLIMNCIIKNFRAHQFNLQWNFLNRPPCLKSTVVRLCINTTYLNR